MSEPQNNAEVTSIENLRRERAMILNAIIRLVNGDNSPNGLLISEYGLRLAAVSEEISAQN